MPILGKVSTKLSNWWTEKIRSEYYCDECEVEFNTMIMFMNHLEADHVNDIEDNPVKSNDEIKSEFYEIKNFPDNREDSEDEEVNKVYGRKKQIEQTGIIMKGRSQAFKDANVVLKSKLTKGMVLADQKGRELKILNILEDDAMEIEVKSLSKKPKEERGQVRPKMYRPNRYKKKLLNSSQNIIRL